MSSSLTKKGVFIEKSFKLFSKDEKYSLTLGHDSFQLHYKRSVKLSNKVCYNKEKIDL